MTFALSRAARQADFPAAFQLVAAMNPCPCGQLGNATTACRCTPDAVLRYQGKISGPLLDRIDIQIEVPTVAAAQLAAAADGEASAVVAGRVRRARDRALERQGHANGELAGEALDRHCRLDDAASHFLQTVDDPSRLVGAQLPSRPARRPHCRRPRRPRGDHDVAPRRGDPVPARARRGGLSERSTAAARALARRRRRCWRFARPSSSTDRARSGRR